jgi:DNA-binding MarR family transcriptional regulator
MQVVYLESIACRLLQMLVVTNNISRMAEISDGKEAKARAASPEEQAYLALLRTADRLEGRMAEWLKPRGFSPTQYNALRILRGAGPEALPCSEVGARMISRDSDITRLVDRLEKRGLVARSRGKKDRRVVRASITKAGLELLRKLDQPVSEFVRGMMRNLDGQELEKLLRLLGQVEPGH